MLLNVVRYYSGNSNSYIFMSSGWLAEADQPSTREALQRHGQSK